MTDSTEGSLNIGKLEWLLVALGIILLLQLSAFSSGLFVVVAALLLALVAVRAVLQKSGLGIAGWYVEFVAATLALGLLLQSSDSLWYGLLYVLDLRNWFQELLLFGNLVLIGALAYHCLAYRSINDSFPRFQTIGLGIAIIVLVVQLIVWFPIAFWLVVRALDIRRWSGTTWLTVNGILLLVLLVLAFRQKLRT